MKSMEHWWNGMSTGGSTEQVGRKLYSVHLAHESCYMKSARG
jgi:hypothetical protein